MIRLVDAADRAELLRMLTARRPTTPKLAEPLDEFLATDGKSKDPLIPKCYFVKARADGHAGGVALLGGFIEIGERAYAPGCETSPVAFIEGWYVDGDLRNTGVGRALVAAAEKWARRRGYTEIGSDLTLGNEISLSAHLALGYVEMERLVSLAKKL